jgi:hypothetical protein
MRYLPFITANVANSVAGIIEDVNGLCAWRIADLTVAPMLVAVGFPVGAVPMTALAGIPAYTAGGIAYQIKAVRFLLNMPIAVGAGIPVSVVVRGQLVGDTVVCGFFFRTNLAHTGVLLAIYRFPIAVVVGG